jgi:hypothetical protein
VTTIMVDDETSGSWTPKDPNFVQPMIQAQLAGKLDPEHYEYNDTMARVRSALESEHEHDRISEATYKGFKDY